MAKILVLYYSSYGHIETMANAVAEGARAGHFKLDRNELEGASFLGRHIAEITAKLTA